MTLILSPLIVKNIIDFKKKNTKDAILNCCWFCQKKCDNFVSICKICKDIKFKKNKN